MEIDKWVAGYKVRAFDWIDGEHIYMNIAQYAPGASVEKAPAYEKSFLLQKSDEKMIQDRLDSVVQGLMATVDRIETVRRTPVPLLATVNGNKFKLVSTTKNLAAFLEAHNPSDEITVTNSDGKWLLDSYGPALQDCIEDIRDELEGLLALCDCGQLRLPAPVYASEGELLTASATPFQQTM